MEAFLWLVGIFSILLMILFGPLWAEAYPTNRFAQYVGAIGTIGLAVLALFAIASLFDKDK
jgi:polyferredoxin